MKFYQIKSMEKGVKPPRWYRILVPSGITFSQLYVLLGYIHEDIYDLSPYFYFSTKDQNVQIEEFVDGEPEFTSSFHDIYDAKGTYIDSFFEEGFKISQYSARDFDLSLLVEKDAEELPELRSPKVIKTSRAIADEEGGQFGDEMIPEELFEVVITTEPLFRGSEELIHDVGNKTLMNASDDPVTPEESIFRGGGSISRDSLHQALELLYEDNDLAPLLKQLDEALGRKQSNDPYLMHRIDNIMLNKRGQTFSEYTLIATIKGFANDTDKLPDLDIKATRPNVSTEAFINSYNKEDLKNIAEDYNIRIAANATKKKLVKVILHQLFTPESIRKRLIQLEDDEMELFRLTSESEYGRLPESENEEINGENLTDNLLAAFLQDGRLFVTDLVRNVYDEADKDALELDRQKSVWMYKCLDIAMAFYGVMSWDVLGQLYARKFKGIGQTELREIFRRTPDFYNPFTEADGKLVLDHYIHNDYYKYLEDRIQGNKPFYIPSRKEIEEFYDKGCLLSSSTHQAMRRFLISSLGYEPKAAELKVKEIYQYINTGARMQTVVDSLENDGKGDFAFRSEEDVRKFVQLYMDMSNRSHLRDNRGYTPDDLFHVMGGMKNLSKDMMITPRGPEAARMLDEARDELAQRGIALDEDSIQSMIGGEKRKKIGRNEPCPCGSGKKYKNCCGK